MVTKTFEKRTVVASETPDYDDARVSSHPSIAVKGIYDFKLSDGHEGKLYDGIVALVHPHYVREVGEYLIKLADHD